MSIGITDSGRIVLARRLQERQVPDWNDFIHMWMAFNVIYDSVSGDTERKRLMTAIKRYVPEPAAVSILAECQSAVGFLSELPPGDLRKPPSSSGFRKRGARDLDIVNDSSRNASERLAHLMAVVYQVRCNLIHGGKNPDSLRDRRLVTASKEIALPTLATILPELEAAQGGS